LRSEPKKRLASNAEPSIMIFQTAWLPLRSLLEPRDGLPECCPPRFSVRGIEIRLFHPAQQRYWINAY
jgi:hypothetical protein